MARTLTTAVKNELLTGQIRPIHLIEIGFSTPVYLTDNSFDLTSSISGSSRTYTASPFLVGGSSFEEQTDITKTSLSITLSGADQTFISVVLNENVINDSVDIFRGFLDDSNALISDPFLLFDGTINKYSIEDDTKTTLIGLEITSTWGQFEKENGRSTSDTSQQRHFASDKGFEFSALTIRNIKWGSA